MPIALDVLLVWVAVSVPLALVTGWTLRRWRRRRTAIASRNGKRARTNRAA